MDLFPQFLSQSLSHLLLSIFHDSRSIDSIILSVRVLFPRLSDLFLSLKISILVFSHTFKRASKEMKLTIKSLTYLELTLGQYIVYTFVYFMFTVRYYPGSPCGAGGSTITFQPSLQHDKATTCTEFIEHRQKRKRRKKKKTRPLIISRPFDNSRISAKFVEKKRGISFNNKKKNEEEKTGKSF